MFNSGNCGIPVTMNVEPSGTSSNGCNGGWGDNGAWWIIIFVLFFAFGGWGNNGWGGNGGNGGVAPYAIGSTYTDAAIARGFDNQGVMNKLNGIEQGVCNLGYENLAQMNSLGMAVANGFHGVDNAICNLGYTTQQGLNATQVANMQGNFALQQAINADTVANMQNTNALATQLANCCCENRAGQKDIQYQMATDTCAVQNTIQNTTRDIIDNQNANSKQILDFLVQDKIASLQAENQSLKLAASQADQNNFIAANQQAQTAELIRRLGADCPQPAYVVQPPQPVTFPTNCCGGVTYASNGCGNGCGGCC